MFDTEDCVKIEGNLAVPASEELSILQIFWNYTNTGNRSGNCLNLIQIQALEGLDRGELTSRMLCLERAEPSYIQEIVVIR